MFAQGARLTLHQAIDRILAGDWIMVHGKPVHPGWAGSWQLMTIRSLAISGIYAAERAAKVEDAA